MGNVTQLRKNVKKKPQNLEQGIMNVEKGEIMKTIEAIQSSRGIKHFDADHSMNAEKANEILSLAVLSPTAFNIQN